MRAGEAVKIHCLRAGEAVKINWRGGVIKNSLCQAGGGDSENSFCERGRGVSKNKLTRGGEGVKIHCVMAGEAVKVKIHYSLCEGGGRQ